MAEIPPPPEVQNEIKRRKTLMVINGAFSSISLLLSGTAAATGHPELVQIPLVAGFLGGAGLLVQWQGLGDLQNAYERRMPQQKPKLESESKKNTPPYKKPTVYTKPRDTLGENIRGKNPRKNEGDDDNT